MGGKRKNGLLDEKQETSAFTEANAVIPLKGRGLVSSHLQLMQNTQSA